MTQTAQEPRIRSGFDFSELPIAPSARILGALGTRLLEGALAPEKPLDVSVVDGFGAGKLFIEKSGTPLTRWRGFSMTDRFVFLWRRIVQGFRRLLRIVAPKLHRRFMGEAEDAVREGYRLIVHHAVRARITPRARRLLLEERLAARLNETWLMPIEMWSMCADVAWSEPRFRYQASRRILDHLRQKVTFQLGEIPNARFDHRTFWLLIALTPPPPKRGFGFGRGKRRRDQIWSDFRAVAQKKAQIGRQWAGFWDQWLIALFLKRDPQLVYQLEPKLRDAVIRLPLLPKAHLYYRYSDEGMKLPPRLSQKDYGASAPGWLGQYFPEPNQRKSIVPELPAGRRFLQRLWARLRPGKKKRKTATKAPSKSQHDTNIVDFES